MAAVNTTKLQLRLRNAVHAALERKAAGEGMDVATFVARLIEQEVFDFLPESAQARLRKENALYDAAQRIARKAYAEGLFDEHFSLTVFDALMADDEARGLYEDLIGADYAEDSPAKWPLNMFLGWFIKNAVPGLAPLMDEKGRPVRAFVKGKPIKSYTLLRREDAQAAA